MDQKYVRVSLKREGFKFNKNLRLSWRKNRKFKLNQWLPNDCIELMKKKTLNLIENIKLVLVRQFRINCASAFLKILKLPRSISKFSKIAKVIYLKNCPNQTCDY